MLRSDILANAEKMIDDVTKVGACDDLGLFELTAIQLHELSIDKPRQLRLMIAAVSFLYVSGNSVRGLNVATKAKLFALGIADIKSLTIVSMLIGICAADTGNLPLAMEAYGEALSLASSQSDSVQEGKIWQNLGAALAYSGLYREAMGCYSRALFLATIAPDLKPYESGIYLNIAASCLNLDEIPQGLSAIRKAVDCAQNPISQHSLLNRVLAENYYTRLLIEVDDFTGAQSHARTARRYADQCKSARAEITASVAEGLAEVFVGQADIGISRLTRTLDRALSLKLASREVLVAIVKAHEHLGHHDKALEYLKQMLASQRQTQEANVLRHVERHLKQLHLKDDGAPMEDSRQAIKRLATRAEVLEGRIAKRELFKQSVEGLERLAVATELRDDSTGEHSYRVGRLASLLAQEAGCDEEMVFMIDIAGRLHDIGKIAIPDGILLKPGPLNDSEREIMEMHAEAGSEVLSKSNIPQIQMAADIARYHHERWDGKGYPEKLSGENIPLAARITALADVFDALTHKRPYKEAWPVETALTTILSLRGHHFDPKLTDLFLALVSRMIREGVDLDRYLGEAARKSSFNQAKSKIWDSLKMAKDEYQAKSARATDYQR